MKTTIILSVIALSLLTACENASEEKVLTTEETTIELSQREKESAIKRGKEIAQNTFKSIGRKP